MSAALPPPQESAFATLRQLARKRSAAAERCEMCRQELGAEHDHVVDPVNRKLICACPACALLFETQAEQKYKRVPRRVVFLRDFQMTDAEWDGLALPIEMAFFFHSTTHGKMIALYPSPAGPTESLLSLDSWNDIVVRNPALNELQPDVSALLVNRVGRARDLPAEYYLVPIDECYKLVGLIRTHWRGLSGGTEVWREITGFFHALKKRAGVLESGEHA